MMIANNMRIFRYEPPTDSDVLPYGTICKVSRHSEFDIYVQICKHENQPNWLFISTFPDIMPSNIVESEIESILNKKINQ
jgi:hypothetical protein